MSLRSSCLVATCLALTTFAALAVEPDLLVKAQLEQEGIPFVIDEDGDFKILVRVEDDRTQLVWVRSVVVEAGTMRVREIWSPGYRSEEASFPAAIANDLLKRSDRLKLSAWVKQDRTAMLVTKILADASPAQLDEAIDLTAVAADAVELDLTGKDDL